MVECPWRTTDVMRKLVPIFLLAFPVSIAGAQQRPCTIAEGRRAEMQTDALRNWDALYRWYKLYRQCDDGAVGEGYAESVARVLVDHWSTLPRLVDLAKKDAGFQRFVLLHIGATLDINDLKKIRSNAMTNCPTGSRAMCTILRREADAAIQEDALGGIK